MTGVSAVAGIAIRSQYAGNATVTVGRYSDPNVATSYGYISSLGGSISPQDWAASELPVYFLYWNSSTFIAFTVTGVAPNYGWETLTIGSYTYRRADASYSLISGGTKTQWLFNDAPVNPFGTTTGATRDITWV